MFKVAIVSTHPIQYNSPLFRELAKVENIIVKVFFTWEQSQEKVFDPKFKREIKWDIPLLDGFEVVFLKNTAKDPGSHHFFGIQNPDAVHEIDRFCPDALLVYGWSFISHLNILRHFKNKIPIFFRGDSNLLDEVPGPKQILRRLLLKKIYKYVDYAFFVGENNKNYYLKHGLKENQLFWVPHTVDNKRFAESSVDTVLARKNLGLPLEGINILFTGKFERKKNPLLLLRAFNRIQRKDINLIFVGNGELEEELKQGAESMENICFLPFQNQSHMPLVYSSADIVVLPSSYNETWGLIINEAMACGKAVVVSNKVGCGVDLVRSGENGYIFQQNDAEDLAEKIVKCINSNNFEKFGAASEAIINKWSIDVAVDLMVKAFTKGR
ncbi:glycosyltransferase family 4 protein [Botryobacter ruber]|uniref:glycosyltransferase family 4 protein n=1 Tax=Botryobacter ruber TaxID=2171629 RepID=UPI000E0A891A|nr:glycosyltransferase family 4 protein [Botryobacter ruber]